MEGYRQHLANVLPQNSTSLSLESKVGFGIKKVGMRERASVRHSDRMARIYYSEAGQLWVPSTRKI